MIHYCRNTVEIQCYIITILVGNAVTCTSNRGESESNSITVTSIAAAVLVCAVWMQNAVVVFEVLNVLACTPKLYDL